MKNNFSIPEDDYLSLEDFYQYIKSNQLWSKWTFANYKKDIIYVNHGNHKAEKRWLDYNNPLYKVLSWNDKYDENGKFIERIPILEIQDGYEFNGKDITMEELTLEIETLIQKKLNRIRRKKLKKIIKKI